MIFRFKKSIKRVFRYCCIGLLLYFLMNLLFPFPYSKLKIRGESLHVYSASNELLHVFTNENDELFIEVDLESISPWLKQATIAAEDKRFYNHDGVDFIALFRASLQNIWSGRRISGASTVTMQLVRMSLLRKRTLTSKIIESFYALQVDSKLSKGEILNKYLNFAPYGGNIYGVEMASLRYFNKSASQLTLAEASFIAGLPQSPSRFNPFNNPDEAYVRRAFVLKKMFELKMITEEERILAENTKFRFVKKGFPFKLPHYVVNLKSRKLVGRIETYINYELQSSVEKIVDATSNELKRNSVHNISMVIYDLKQEGFVSWIGSGDYFDIQNCGQINGPLAKRSAGSVLKPFLYGMAYENGMMIPGSILKDNPFVVSGYVPKNYDLKYFGNLSAKNSLLLSRNIPAVKLLKRIGLVPFEIQLSDLGFKHFNSKIKNHGLSLALGSCDVSLIELINAYACIARKGIFKKCQYYINDGKVEARRCFTEETSYLIYDSLMMESNKFARPIALKTGTSWDYRDAWAIAFDARFVVGVWAGNFKGSSSSELVANEIVVPVVEKVFGVIDYSFGLAPIEKPLGVKSILVCAGSGRQITPNCKASKESLMISGISSVPFCEDCLQSGSVSNQKNFILSPKKNEIYYLLASQQDQEIKLVSSYPNQTGYWFVDGEFYQKNEFKDVYLKLRKGRHQITLCDSELNSHSINFTVK